MTVAGKTCGQQKYPNNSLNNKPKRPMKTFNKFLILCALLLSGASLFAQPSQSSSAIVADDFTDDNKDTITFFTRSILPGGNDALIRRLTLDGRIADYQSYTFHDYYGFSQIMTLKSRPNTRQIQVAPYSIPTASLASQNTAYLNGYMGIGVESPQERLHIDGNLKFGNNNHIEFQDDGEIRSYDGYHRIRFARDSNRLEFREWGDIIFASGDQYNSGNDIDYKMILTASGNLGLGNNLWSPSQKLEVDGTAKSKGLLINTTTNNWGLVSGTVATINGAVHISPQYVAPTSFNTSEYLDDYLLWVEEGIVTEDLAIVNADEWSDFVFEENYTLMSIKELAKFIKEKGHLPEIPTRAEVKEKGYSVHEINKKLLQKIEELTLYIIDQDEKLDKQQSAFEQLTIRLEKIERKLK